MGDSGLAIVDADYFLYDLGKISMAVRDWIRFRVAEQRLVHE